jgi:hypothetical protein
MLSITRLLEAQLDVILICTASWAKDKSVERSHLNALPFNIRLPLSTSSICILDASY